MDENTKHIIASNLTVAFYSGQEPRKPFLGEDQRGAKTKPDDVRDLRSPTITPGEVLEVYNRFFQMLG